MPIIGDAVKPQIPIRISVLVTSRTFSSVVYEFLFFLETLF